MNKRIIGAALIGTVTLVLTGYQLFFKSWVNEEVKTDETYLIKPDYIPKCYLYPSHLSYETVFNVGQEVENSYAFIVIKVVPDCLYKFETPNKGVMQCGLDISTSYEHKDSHRPFDPNEIKDLKETDCRNLGKIYKKDYPGTIKPSFKENDCVFSEDGYKYKIIALFADFYLVDALNSKDNTFHLNIRNDDKYLRKIKCPKEIK